MKILAIDLDGVLCDFANPFLTYINKRLKSSYKPENLKDCERICELLNLKPGAEAPLIYRFYKEFGLENLPLIQGAAQGLQFLLTNFSPYIITARDSRYEAQTFAWLKKHFPDIQSPRFIITDRHRRYRKHEVCKSIIGSNLMIEDSPANAEELASNGIKVLLLESLGSRNYIPKDGILKVQDWPSLVNYLSSNSF